MSQRRRTRRNELGVVLPTRLMVFSISVVALAGLVFVATQGSDSPDTASPTAAAPTASSTYAGPQNQHTDGAEPQVAPTPKPVPVVKRGAYNVVVYNNTNITGLAGKTSTRASRVGWNVLATDNWTGTVDASTVFFGPRMKAAAQLLARDLGITRVKPYIKGVNGMRPDRLTVILTSDYR